MHMYTIMIYMILSSFHKNCAPKINRGNWPTYLHRTAAEGTLNSLVIPPTTGTSQEG